MPMPTKEQIKDTAQHYLGEIKTKSASFATMVKDRVSGYGDTPITVPDRVAAEIASVTAHLSAIGASAEQVEQASKELTGLYVEKYNFQKINGYCVNTYEKLCTQLLTQLACTFVGQQLHQQSLYNSLVPEWVTGSATGVASVFGASAAFEKWGHLLTDINVELSDTCQSVKGFQAGDAEKACLQISNEYNKARFVTLKAKTIQQAYMKQENQLMVGAQVAATLTPAVTFGIAPNTEISRLALRGASTAITTMYLAKSKAPKDMESALLKKFDDASAPAVEEEKAAESAPALKPR